MCETIHTAIRVTSGSERWPNLRYMVSESGIFKRILQKMLIGNVIIINASCRWQDIDDFWKDSMCAIFIRDAGFGKLPKSFILAKDIDEAYSLAQKHVNKNQNQRHTKHAHIFIEDSTYFTQEGYDVMDELIEVECARALEGWSNNIYAVAQREGYLDLKDKFKNQAQNVLYKNDDMLPSSSPYRLTEIRHLHNTFTDKKFSYTRTVFPKVEFTFI